MPPYNFNTTDAVVFVLLLLFFITGWRQGLFRSALGPITCLLCSVGGIVFFDVTQNAIKAILLTMVGSIIFTVIISSLFALGKQSIDPPYRDYSPLIGRLLGSAINLLWQGGMLAMAIFLLIAMPLKIPQLDKIKADIQNSFSYDFLTTDVLPRIPPVKKMLTSFSIFNNPDQIQVLSSTPEFQAFCQNKKVQALIQDETFMDSVRKKDLSRIMDNPKIWDMLQDDKVMENLGNLAMKVYSLNLPAAPASQPAANEEDD